MLLLGKRLGLLSITYIQSLLFLGCTAILDSERISMEYMEDDHDNFYLKSSRKPLSVGNNGIVHLNNRTIESDRPWFWFCLIVGIILLFLILVRCCIRLAREQEEYEQNSGLTVHPPPRTQPFSRLYTPSRSSTPSYGSSRILAPPRTSSRSLILLPEPGLDHNVYFEIENPNFHAFAVNLDVSDQRNHQPINVQANILPPSSLPQNDPSPSNPLTQIEDLPPDYDSIVKANENDKRSTRTSNIPSGPQNSEKVPPPKYEDLH